MPIWSLPGLVLGIVLAECSPPETTDRVPGNPRSGVVGLFVGVGDYDDPTIPDLSLHRTNERVLRPLLRERYGVEWRPSVLDATRPQVREALLDLLAECRRRRQGGQQVTALFMYAGHGSRVRDQDGDEPDGLDETFVLRDSSAGLGRGDLRDDDLQAFARMLDAEGVPLLMIVDACHSETSFRGPPMLSLARHPPARGPSQRLFEGAEFDQFYARATNSDAVGEPDLVSLAASADDQPAMVMTTASGEDWGVFSLAIARALAEVPSDATYAEVFERVSVLVEELGRENGTRQRPAISVSGSASRDQNFLGTAFRSVPVRVVAVEPQGAVLSAGIERGFEEGAMVALARIDPNGRSQSIGSEFTVREAGLGWAVVIGDGAEVGLVARVTAPAAGSGRILVDPKVPVPVREAMTRARSAGRISTTSDLRRAILAVEATDEGGVELRWASEETHAVKRSVPIVPWRLASLVEDARRQARRRPDPIARWSAESFEKDPTRQADAVLDRVERSIRLHRLELLSRAPEEIEVAFSPVSRRVESGGFYEASVENASREKRFIHLVEVVRTDAGGYEGQVIPLPVPGGSASVGVALEPGASMSLRLKVSLGGGATFEEVTHVWISTTKRIGDLKQLVAAPVTARAASDPTIRRLNDVLDRGVPLARGGSSDGQWAARSIRFEIVGSTAVAPPASPAIPAW